MIYSISYTPPATRDIRCILDYISYAIFEPQAALSVVNAITARISKLETMPVRYPVYRDWPVKTEKIRYFTVKNYVVFYSCNEKNLTVSIVRVIYGGRDIAAELKKTDSFHA